MQTRSPLLLLVVLLSSLMGWQSLVAAQDPPFPELSEVFVANAEANILEHNYTVNLLEYFNSTRNVTRFEVLANGNVSVRITDYNRQLSYHTHVADRTCTVGPIRPSPFNARGADGNTHLVGVSDFWSFGKKYHERYEGIKTIRGIPCHHYVGRKLGTEHGVFSNITLHWYFAAQDGWRMPVGNVEPLAIPVRLIVVGESNRTHIPGGVGVVHPFHHIYEISAFHVGQAAVSAVNARGSELFSPPRGIQCKGLPAGKSLPRMPNQFAILMTDVRDFHIHYAYDAERAETSATCHYLPPNLPPGVIRSESIRVVRNFREGTQYRINGSQCLTSALSDGDGSRRPFNDVECIGHAHASLGPVQDLFFGPGVPGDARPDAPRVPLNFTYVGPRLWGTIEAEMWSVVRNDVQLDKNKPADQTTLWEYTFSTPRWTYSVTRDPADGTPVPLEARAYTVDDGVLRSHLEFADFEVGPPDASEFDDNVCFTTEQQTTLTFVMDTPFDNYAALEGALIDRLAAVMTVTVDRFAITAYPGAENKLTVVVRVHDPPTVGDQTLLKKLTSRRDAIHELHHEVHRRRFKVSGVGVGEVTAVRDSLETSDRPADKRLSNGAVAGLTVSLFLIGIVCGAGAWHLVQKRFADKVVPYKSTI